MAKVTVELDFPGLTIQEMEDRDFFEQMDDEYVIVDEVLLKRHDDNSFFVFRVVDKFDEEISDL